MIRRSSSCSADLDLLGREVAMSWDRSWRACWIPAVNYVRMIHWSRLMNCHTSVQSYLSFLQRKSKLSRLRLLYNFEKGGLIRLCIIGIEKGLFPTDQCEAFSSFAVLKDLWIVAFFFVRVEALSETIYVKSRHWLLFTFTIASNHSRVVVLEIELLLKFLIVISSINVLLIFLNFGFILVSIFTNLPNNWLIVDAKSINVCSMNSLIGLHIRWPIILSHAHTPHPTKPNRPLPHRPQRAPQQPPTGRSTRHQAEPPKTHLEALFHHLHAQNGCTNATITAPRPPPRRVRDRRALAMLGKRNAGIKGKLLRAERVGAWHSPAGRGGRRRPLQPQRSQPNLQLLQVGKDTVQLSAACLRGRGVRIKCYN